MHTILLLDTSIQGALLGVACSQDSKTWTLSSWVWHELPHAAAAQLAPLCRDVLLQAGRTLEQVDHVVVGVGPGSFTGIKIGLSFAYGLHRARSQLRLTGVSSLQAFTRARSDPSLVLLMATQTSGYFARKTTAAPSLGVVDAESGWSLRYEGQDTTPHDWSQSPVILGAWPRLTAMLEEKGQSAVELALPTLAEPILQAMLQDFIANSSQLSDGLPGPLYLRKSAPEEKLERKVAAGGTSEALHKGGS